jgi:hypothetical protein
LIDQGSTLEEVCFAVAGALEKAELRAVLTGGSAAAIYAPKSYTSYDADFVLEGVVRAGELERALLSIGFRPTAAGGMFAHALTSYTVDFPKGPLAVGAEYVRESAALKRGGITLRILTPTDCVRDRLAHFYFWDDYTALAAAVGVTRSEHGNAVDIDDLRKWTRRESAASGSSYAPKFAEFNRRVKE